MHRMGAQRGGKVTGVCPSAALDSLPPSEPRAPFPATAVGATSVAVAFPSLLLPQTAADGACRPPAADPSVLCSHPPGRNLAIQFFANSRLRC